MSRLAIHPGDRFESVRQMQRALDRRLAEVKLEQRSAQVSTPPWQPVKRRPSSAPRGVEREPGLLGRYLRDYSPHVTPVVLPILKPVTVIVVLTVVVTALFSTSSAVVAGAILGPFVVGGLIYHRIRRLRNREPPRF